MTRFYSYVSHSPYDGSSSANATYDIHLEGVGKCISEDSAYLIANEWISANLAWFLRLPVPPFALLKKHTPQMKMFATIKFNGDTRPGDAVPDTLCAKHLELCTGIILFDVLIANSDRHAGNIKVDDPNNPKEVNLFDHDRALFYIYENEGVQHLIKFKSQPFIRNHCLKGSIGSFKYLHKWIQRIEQIPEWFIRDICENVKDLGITAEEKNQVVDFLLYRRDHIFDLLKQEEDEFIKIENWPVI